MTTPRRIVFASHTADLSGAERGLVELAGGLAARGHTVSVLIPRHGPLADLLDEAGLPWFVEDYRWWARIHRRYLRRIRHITRQLSRKRRIARLLRELQPDVVITNTVVIPAPALAARSLGIPHIWYLREFGKLDHRFHFDLGFTNSARLIGRWSQAVIVNCRALADYFVQWIPADKLHVVYNAVRLNVEEAQLDVWRAERGAEDEVLRCVILGRIHPAKGQIEALHALARLRDRGVHATLAIVGQGQTADEQELDAMIHSLRLEDRVDRVGFSSEPLRHLCRADVALVCSTHEAFGRVVVEALKVGCPVIVSDNGGIVEHVKPGVNGYSYPPGDIDALAERMERLARDPEHRRALAVAAREGANATYRLDRQVPEVEAVLDRVLEGAA